MNRNLKKAIQEYDRRFGEGKSGSMYLGDLLQIMDISNFRSNQDAYNLIIVSMKAGFMIGHRVAIRSNHF